MNTSQEEKKMKESRNKREHSKQRKLNKKHRERSTSSEKSRSQRRSARSPNERHKNATYKNSKSPRNRSTETKGKVDFKTKMKTSERPQSVERKSKDTDEDRVGKKIKRGKEKIDCNDEYLGYSNTCNPFGDENLLGTFVWKKKLEAQGRTDVSLKKIKKEQKRAMLENRDELEQVQKRVQLRERERAAREEERYVMQRDKEASFYDHWEQQEDAFHFQQAKLRSKIRMEDDRAKPIDLLAQYVQEENDDFFIELTEPYNLLNGLTITDLEDLLEDIKVYLELEQRAHSEYWADITVIAEEELKKLRKLDPACAEYISDSRSCVHSSVQEDVAKIFKGKTLNQLDLLDREITKRLRGGEGVDIAYWDNLAQQLKVFMAKQRLKERHKEQLRDRLVQLKQEQCIDSATNSSIPQTDIKEEEDAILSTLREDVGSHNVTSREHPVNDGGCDEEEYLSGCYSPVLIRPDDLPPGSIVVDLAEDLERLRFSRQQVLAPKQREINTEEELLKKTLTGDVEGGDFADEVALKEEIYHWSDKFRPRKPRFCNKVHTGFEWNKYNQTHYDADNPPPRVVQGYKFNIFYPDLIDKTKIPQYSLVPCRDKNFAVIRFSAGPPYEDIAFKIVNREWETSNRRGFRCYFQNSTMQLWFHFRRLRYRK